MEHDLLAEAVGPLPFPSFWTLDELARLLTTEPAEIRRMLRAHELPAFFVGGRWLISTADLIRWLICQRQPGDKRNGRKRRR